MVVDKYSQCGSMIILMTFLLNYLHEKNKEYRTRNSRTISLIFDFKIRVLS